MSRRWRARRWSAHQDRRPVCASESGCRETSPAIVIQDVSLWYGTKQALFDISMDIGAKAGHRVHRPVRVRQVHAAALPQPDERPHRRRAGHRDVLRRRRRTSTPTRPTSSSCGSASAWCSRSRTRFPKSIYENVVYGLRIAGIKSKATLDEACERSLRRRRPVGRGQGPAARERPRSPAASSSGSASPAPSPSSPRSC